MTWASLETAHCSFITNTESIMNNQVIEILKNALSQLEQLEKSQEQLVARMTLNSLIGCCQAGPLMMSIWTQAVDDTTKKIMIIGRQLYSQNAVQGKENSDA